MNKRVKMIVAGIFGILLIIGFLIYSSGNDNSENEIEKDLIPEIELAEIEFEEVVLAEADSWKDFELQDVRTKEIFKISDFSDEIVLLESFAVWCPTCKQQQDQIKELIEEGSDAVHISIDTDPNEDAARVIEHANRYSYNWRYVVFPALATLSLVDDFGVGIVNAPRVPVLLICPGEEPRLLKSGIKTSEELKTEIESCGNSN